MSWQCKCHLLLCCVFCDQSYITTVYCEQERACALHASCVAASTFTCDYAFMYDSYFHFKQLASKSPYIKPRTQKRSK